MKLRTPGTLSAAINEIKNKLSEEKCAEIVDRSESLIRKWTDPDDPALPNLRQSLMLDSVYVKAGFGEPPIQTWYTERLEKVVSDNPKKSVNIVMSTLHAQAAIGQIASAIAQFTEEGSEDQSSLSANERAVLLSMIETLSFELDRLEVSLETNMGLPGPLSFSNILNK